MRILKFNVKTKLSIAIALLFSIIIIFLIVRKRNAIYGFDTGKSYEYVFNEKYSNLIDTNLKNKKLVLPSQISIDHTVFIKLFVKSSFLGNYFEPSLKMIKNQHSFVQYFESGTHGYRYINISSLIEKGAKEIEFIASKMSLDDQAVQLIAFKNQPLHDAKILVIAPHPDDAEIAAYGLYSKFPKSFVLTITSGDTGDFKYDELYKDSSEHYIKKGKIRTWNSISVPLLGGISKDSILNLAFYDSTLKEMYYKDSLNVMPLHIDNKNIMFKHRDLNISSMKQHLTGTSNWPSLIENIKSILVSIQPDIIVTPYPLIDTHDDHKFSTIALFQALKELQIKKGSLFLYTNHFKNDYYPNGEIGSVISLPPSFKNDIYFRSIYSNHLDTLLQSDKIIALEAMNDIRMDTEWRFWDKQLKESMLQLNRKIVRKEKDYFRRSVRSNELFFEIPISDIYDNIKLEYIIGKEVSD